MSEEFPPTDKSASGPLCLRFWTHMYGNGIGSLNVYVRGASSGDSKIWGLTGDAGNNWYMGQAPIAATESFRVRIFIKLYGLMMLLFRFCLKE